MRSARLADLHHGEVEAEGLDLPLELKQLSVRRALKPIGGETCAKFSQLADQRLRGCVSANLTGSLNACATGTCNALRDRSEATSIRFVGEALRKGALTIAKVLRVANKRCAECTIKLTTINCRGD